eukprot:480477_1
MYIMEEVMQNNCNHWKMVMVGAIMIVELFNNIEGLVIEKKLVLYGLGGYELEIHGFSCDDNERGLKTGATRAGGKRNCGRQEIKVIGYGYMMMIIKCLVDIKVNLGAKKVVELAMFKDKKIKKRGSVYGDDIHGTWG